MHSQEELEPLLAPLKEQMREDGNHKTTYDFFVSRVQKNLHVALCMVSGGIPLWWDAGVIEPIFARRVSGEKNLKHSQPLAQKRYSKTSETQSIFITNRIARLPHKGHHRHYQQENKCAEMNSSPNHQMFHVSC